MYYIKFSSYWAHDGDFFTGPFDSFNQAVDVINSVINEPDSLAVTADRMAVNVKDGIKIYGILTATESKKQGRNNWNTFDVLPKNTDELRNLENDYAWAIK